MKHFYLFLLLSLYFIKPVFSQETWSEVLPTIGTFSSPRLSDLNKDGVKDIILGGGRLEFQKCDTAMFALDGRDGKLLWKASAIDQIFGSAALMDITNDGTEDVFLNGRSSELKAINGATGKVIWAFDTTYYSFNKTKRWFNFYNPQFIHDADNDGLKDILISNGGDIWIAPHNPNRAKGRLVVISSKTGKLIADADMPDDCEIYMSISIDFDEKNRLTLITGSNMSGKSTFLRTVGLNIILAYAGCPVFAKKMNISFGIKLICYMRIKDSIQQNASTFKAEIERIKLVLASINNNENALFLIDEMLRGTNSEDKLAGSRALLEKIVNSKAYAMVATHDLRMTEISEQYPNEVKNFYFEYATENGELLFDYLIKEGVCKSFNASLLLKSIGLPIGEKL